MTKEAILTNQGEAWEYTNRLKVTPVESAYNAMDEYAKQQAIAFLKWGIQEYIIHPTTDETVCVEGFEHAHPAFEKAAADRYDQFIEQQNKGNDKTTI